MATATTSSPRAPDEEVADTRSPVGPRRVLLVVLAFSSGLYLWLGHGSWFLADDWDPLVDRSGTSIYDLFRPHSGHWSTAPILLYKALYAVFGIRSYLPYVVPLVLAHVLLAYLLWLVICRAEVDPWIATAAASLFALSGVGSQGFVWAFQIPFTGALVCGFGQLLISDHDGAIDRRDGLALALGAFGLLWSGVAVTMVVVVGISLLVRRGWRAAALQTVPLGVAYVVWYAVVGHEDSTGHPPLGRMASFAFEQFKGEFRLLGGFPFVGVALFVVLVAGSALAWTTRSAWHRRQLVAPFALLAGTLVFVGIAALARAGLSAGVLGAHVPAAPSRYLYVLATLVLPALAVAVDAIGHRIPRVGALALLVFVIAIPPNLRSVVHDQHAMNGPLADLEQDEVAIARLPISRQLPRSLEPIPTYLSTATIGWLMQARSEGKLPSIGAIPPAVTARLTQALALETVPVPASTAGCKQATRSVALTFPQGTVVVAPAGHPATITYEPASGPTPVPVSVGSPTAAGAVRARVSGLRFAVVPSAGGSVAVCLPR